MAKYSYDELRLAATSGRRIGGWKNKNVYACSKYDYKITNEAFYVIYDDSNKLVLNGYVYGSISKTGEVTEVSPYAYKKPKKNAEPAVIKSIPATGTVVESDVNVDDFFARIDREINELLAETANREFV